jgi:hypothetical protein
MDFRPGYKRMLDYTTFATIAAAPRLMRLSGLAAG